MIEVIARRRSRMIRMRVVVADHAVPAASRVVIGAFGLLGCYQVASLSGLPPFVLGRIDFSENIGLAIAVAEPEAASFVRISLLTVLSYSILVFTLDFDCPSPLHPFP